MATHLQLPRPLGAEEGWTEQTFYECPMLIGRDTVFNQEYVLDLTNDGHILVVGATRSGKSVFMKLLTALCMRRRFALLGIDTPGVLLNGFDDRFTDIARTVDEAEKLLIKVRRLYVHRIGRMQEFGIEVWHSGLGPRIVFLLDEVPELTNESIDPMVENFVAELASSEAKANARKLLIISGLQQLAKVGINMVLGTQQATAEILGSSVVASQCSRRFVFKLNSEQQVLPAFGFEDPAITVNSWRRPGHACVLGCSHEQPDSDNPHGKYDWVQVDWPKDTDALLQLAEKTSPYFGRTVWSWENLGVAA